MTVGIYAGIPVRDYPGALEWYKRFLGQEPLVYPNDIEALWELGDNCYVYIIEDGERAGGAVNMIWVDDPQSYVARIAKQGIEFDDLEKHDQVWKYVFHDADGNEIGVGGEVAYRS